MLVTTVHTYSYSYNNIYILVQFKLVYKRRTSLGLHSEQLTNQYINRDIDWLSPWLTTTCLTTCLFKYSRLKYTHIHLYVICNP